VGRRLVGYTKKIRFWDKTAAISMAMRQFGQFEKDNRQQRQPNVNLQINIVGSPPTEDGVFNKTITD
jgi:hypothetical protein